jgi:hypothetical protein
MQECNPPGITGPTEMIRGVEAHSTPLDPKIIFVVYASKKLKPI